MEKVQVVFKKKKQNKSIFYPTRYYARKKKSNRDQNALI